MMTTCQRCLKAISDGVHTCTPTEFVRKLEQEIESLRKENESLKASVYGVYELEKQLAESEAERLEQARLNGMGSEREAALLARLEECERERDILRSVVTSDKQDYIDLLKQRDELADAERNLWDQRAVERFDALLAKVGADKTGEKR